MKVKYKVIIGILVMLSAFCLGITLFQIKETIDTLDSVSMLKRQKEELEKDIKNDEETGKQIQEEIEELNRQLDEREQEDQEMQVLQDEQQEILVSERNGKKVAVDPGHQGYHVNMSDLEPMGPGSQEMKAKATQGAEGRFTGVPEYELNLTISKQLEQELQKRGYDVMLTRQDNDTAISNRERALLAADFGADIYIRIHANGSDDPSVSGALVMVPSANNPYVAQLHDKSNALGEAIINAYCQSCGIPNKGVIFSDDMTGINWNQMPVTILEMGFMTNQSDDTNMQNADFQIQMVQGIANGIDQYFMAEN